MILQYSQIQKIIKNNH